MTSPAKLCEAIEQNDLAKFESLLAKSTNVTGAKNHIPLIACAESWGDNSARMATMLIAKGADVNAGQPSGWTPLHTAVYESNLEIVRVLLEHGADREARTTKTHHHDDESFPPGLRPVDIWPDPPDEHTSPEEITIKKLLGSIDVEEHPPLSDVLTQGPWHLESTLYLSSPDDDEDYEPDPIYWEADKQAINYYAFATTGQFEGQQWGNDVTGTWTMEGGTLIVELSGERTKGEYRQEDGKLVFEGYDEEHGSELVLTYGQRGGGLA